MKLLISLAFSLIILTTNANASGVYYKAASYQGLHERQHKAQIQRITKVNPARVPWCAAFVNGILRAAGHSGTGSNKAISFAKYKRPTKAPKKGDIVVFRSHVGFFQSFTGNGRVAVLGGNQSNRVKVSHFSTRSVISYRSVS